MAVYEYKALERGGKRVKGVVDADSPVSARRKLRDQNLFPTNLKAAKGEAGERDEDAAQLSFGSVSTRDIAVMTRQLAVLLNAGMPLVDAMGALIEQTSRPKLRKAIYDIRGRIESGKPFADGLAAHPRIFSPLYVNMVRAGETGGSLETVLLRLADILEHQARLKSKVLSTLAYPIFMAAFAVGIISFLTLVIVPRITQLFEQQEQELPWMTELMMGTTAFLGSYWYILLGIVLLLFAGWRYWISRPEGRLAWDRMKLRFPLYGALHVKLVCARFGRILGTMLTSGLTMMRALEVVNTVVQNRYIESRLEEVMADVRRGRGLAQPMRATGVFPSLLIHMVDLGQRSGELENMLIKVAETYEEDVTVTVDALVSLLEPIIIIVMGLFVGFLVLSILLPILNMSSGIGS